MPKEKEDYITIADLEKLIKLELLKYRGIRAKIWKSAEQMSSFTQAAKDAKIRKEMAKRFEDIEPNITNVLKRKAKYQDKMMTIYLKSDSCSEFGITQSKFSRNESLFVIGQLGCLSLNKSQKTSEY